jgi:TonB family protein
MQEYGPSKLPGLLALCLGLVCLGVNVHRAHGQEQELQPERVAVAYVRERPGQNIRDGAGVSVDLGVGAVRHRTSVEYPGSAIEKKVEGMVIVEATLDGSGDVTDARVLSGPAELRRSALQSVLDWQFAPDATGSVRQVSITYRLAEATTAGDREARTVTVSGKSGTYTFSMPVEFRANSIEFTTGVRASEEEARNLEEQMEELRTKLATDVGEISQTAELEKREILQDQVKELEQRIVEIQRERGSLTVREAGPENAAGHRLARIDTVGFSAPARAALLYQLPVQIGDTLTEQTLETLASAVRKSDEHRELRVIRLDNGDVALRIVSLNVRHGLTVTNK